MREGKPDKKITRLTVFGDRIKYPGNCGTPMDDLITVKLLLNRLISTLGEKSMTLDIKNIYLDTHLA